LLQCAAYVSGQQNAVPLAVDFGRWTNGSYHRAPSIVLVFRDNDPATVSVFVYGPKCDGNSLRTFSQVPTGD
jgi:hypothetical protein